mmetsp:Transcript_7969/g.11838  ORF Transcript_7969/g.11838 Transcript_7969/m.11838 type:complete len:651 (+) Transcript_7969:59-2011(+)
METNGKEKTKNDDLKKLTSNINDQKSHHSYAYLLSQNQRYDSRKHNKYEDKMEQNRYSDKQNNERVNMVKNRASEIRNIHPRWLSNRQHKVRRYRRMSSIDSPSTHTNQINTSLFAPKRVVPKAKKQLSPHDFASTLRSSYRSSSPTHSFASLDSSPQHNRHRNSISTIRSNLLKKHLIHDKPTSSKRKINNRRTTMMNKNQEKLHKEALSSILNMGTMESLCRPQKHRLTKKKLIPPPTLSFAHKPEVPKLRFRGNGFECGNLEHAVPLSSDEYDLYLRPDTKNSNQRLWFYFAVAGATRGQKVLFHIVNFSKTKSLYAYGMSPLYRTERQHSKWRRMPQTDCYYYRSPRHQNQWVLSFYVNFTVVNETYYFAYCYPYSYKDLQLLLDNRLMSNVRRQVLTRSLHNRNIELLHFGSIHDPKPIIMLTARVHPGETPSSYVMHGFISFLCSSEATKLLEMCTILIVPMLNPDGVALGNYRCNSLGIDLNRAWRTPTKERSVPIYAVKNFILSLPKKLDMYFDIHAHSASPSAFMYVNPDERNQRDHFVLPKLLARKNASFSLGSTHVNHDTSKLGTARRVLGDLCQAAKFAYTFECSFFGFESGGKCIPFTQTQYMDLGRDLGRSLLEYYSDQSFIEKHRRASEYNLADE